MDINGTGSLHWHTSNMMLFYLWVLLHHGHLYICIYTVWSYIYIHTVNICLLYIHDIFIFNLFFLKHILLKYSWLSMFQVHSKVIQLYIYTYIIFEVIFYYRLLQYIHYSSLWKESESRSVTSDSLWPHALYSPWNSPGHNTGVGSLSLHQGNLPNPGIEPRSPALQVDSLPAEPQGKPKNTGVVAFSSRSSQPRNLTRVSCIAVGVFTNWARRVAHTI